MSGSLLNPSGIGNTRSATPVVNAGASDNGTLRVEGRDYRVDVLDETADGFVVMAENLPQLPANRLLTLVTTSGEHQLKFVWHRRHGDYLRVGLRRIADRLEQTSSDLKTRRVLTIFYSAVAIVLVGLLMWDWIV